VKNVEIKKPGDLQEKVAQSKVKPSIFHLSNNTATPGNKMVKP